VLYDSHFPSLYSTRQLFLCYTIGLFIVCIVLPKIIRIMPTSFPLCMRLEYNFEHVFEYSLEHVFEYSLEYDFEYSLEYVFEYTLNILQTSNILYIIAGTQHKPNGWKT